MPNVAEQIKKANFIFDKVDLDQGLRAEFFKQFFQYAENPVALEAINIISANEEALQQTIDIFANLPGDIVDYWTKQVRPYMIFTPGKLDHIRVFPNIIVNAVPFTRLKDISVTSIVTVIGKLLEQYEDDMSGRIPKANEKWATPERISKRLNQFVDYPTAQALTNQLNMGDNYKDDVIRDLAVKIDTMRKPMELLFADKPEDFVVMYGQKGVHSCMAHKDSWNFMKDAGHTATSFYAYFPYTRGAYLMKNGSVIARVILYADKDADISDCGYPNFNKSTIEKWYYGCPYTANPEANNELMKALKSRGYKSLANAVGARGNHFVPPNTMEFVMPGIKHGNHYSIPFPYFDNMDYHGSGFCAAYNNKTHEFVITYTDKDGNIPNHHQTGYLSSADYITKKCDHCGYTQGRLQRNWISTEDDHIYCSQECATKADYSIVWNTEHAIWIKIGNPENFVQATDGKLFTNAKAAYNHGYYMPAIYALAPEEGTKLVYPTSPTARGHSFKEDIFMAHDGEWTSQEVPIKVIHRQKVVELQIEDVAA